jgi:hypothetical protein
MARSISCTLVEVPVMADSLAIPSLPGFRDLVPWADPYIVQIIQKLQRASCGALVPDWPDTGLSAEAPPPLLEPNTETPLPRTRGDWPRRF